MGVRPSATLYHIIVGGDHMQKYLPIKLKGWKIFFNTSAPHKR